ncbi:hypothetical protein ACUXK4_004505 [Methylorubrum extorquens]
MTTGIYLALQPGSLPVLIVLAALVAVALPLAQPRGGLLRQALAGIGLGFARALIAVLVALGLLVACQVSGAVLQGAVNAAAAGAAIPGPTEQELQRGPERGA